MCMDLHGIRLGGGREGGNKRGLRWVGKQERG